jgi:hypothetical protein
LWRIKSGVNFCFQSSKPRGVLSLFCMEEKY